jgi:hypothetical protein
MNCRKFSKLGEEGVLAFAQEFLGYWFPAGLSEPSVIDPAGWDSLATADPPREGKAVLAFKFAPDGSEGVVAACLKAEGRLPHVECVAIRSMTGGLSWFEELAAQRAGYLVRYASLHLPRIIPQTSARMQTHRVSAHSTATGSCTIM